MDYCAKIGKIGYISLFIKSLEILFVNSYNENRNDIN